MRILAIDPGNTQSAFVRMDDDYKPIEFAKIDNGVLLNMMAFPIYDIAVIEMISSYGMAVGREVFDTCVWIGRYIEASKDAVQIYRRDVKLHLCNSARAKDSNIIQALKDRFGDKGVKAAPGWFYGFKADCWQAYALGCTYLDQIKAEVQK